MSAIASTSDLSRQPDFDSSTAVPTKRKKGSKKGGQKQASSAAKVPKASTAASLGYGYNGLSGNVRYTKYIENARAKPLEVLRSSSDILQYLPFKSALLYSPQDLSTALKTQYAAELKEGGRGLEILKKGAQVVSDWEGSLFGNATQYTHTQRTMVRKLRLLPGDEVLHAPLALAEQAEYFGRLKQDNLGRWISVFTPFIAFDFAASQVIPQSVVPLRPTPDAVQYQHAPLEPSVVKKFNNLLGKYYQQILSFCNAVTARNADTDGHADMVDMVNHGNKEAKEGIAMANIGMAVLGLKYHLNRAPANDCELVVNGINQFIRDEAERLKQTAPSLDLIDDQKMTHSLVAFLCATLISPLCLVMGKPLYGDKPALSAHHTFMIWQQIAYLDLPPWLAWFDRDMKGVLTLLLLAEDKADPWQPVVEMAMRWKDYITKNPPTEEDLRFFKDRLVEKGKDLKTSTAADFEEGEEPGKQVELNVEKQPGDVGADAEVGDEGEEVRDNEEAGDKQPSLHVEKPMQGMDVDPVARTQASVIVQTQEQPMDVDRLDLSLKDRDNEDRDSPKSTRERTGELDEDDDSRLTPLPPSRPISPDLAGSPAGELVRHSPRPPPPSKSPSPERPPTPSEREQRKVTSRAGSPMNTDDPPSAPNPPAPPPNPPALNKLSEATEGLRKRKRGKDTVQREQKGSQDSDEDGEEGKSTKVKRRGKRNNPEPSDAEENEDNLPQPRNRKGKARGDSHQPSVAIKIEEYVPRTLTKAREKIETDWNSLKKWPTLQIDSDIEEYVVPPQKQPQPVDGKKSKPILDPSTSFVVRALGDWRPGIPKPSQGEGVKKVAVEEDGEEEKDEDGDWSTDEERDDEKAGRGVYRLKADGESEPDPTDSDREYRADDVDEDQDDAVSDEAAFANSPYKVVEEDELSPMLLYDVRVTLPKTVRWRGRRLLKTIDRATRNLNIPADTNWLETYSLSEWNEKPIEEIEKSMKLNHAFIIRSTGLNAGWNFDMRSATKIKGGPQLVEVQDFGNRHRPTGVHHSKVPLLEVVHPDHRDPQKVLNLLNAPQRNSLVQIPRQSDLDFGSMALKARQERCVEPTAAEIALDIEIQTGLNWGIISQESSLTLGHVDTGGVCTGIGILEGVKIWGMRKTALMGRTEIDVDDTEYFVDLTERDFASLPGAATDWLMIILFPGDVLIIPPHARHMVYTVAHTIMAGIHFYHFSQLERSVCGWICSLFTTTHISNASHECFLSIVQAHSTFYLPAFSKKSSRLLSKDDPIVRTCPHPDRSDGGLSVLLAIAVTLVFNDTLSGVAKPYRGKYFEMDMLAFKKIWTSVARDGYVESSRLNYDGGLYESTIRAELSKLDVWDDRWTCAGLGEVLVHVARAIVHLSELWEKNRDKKAFRKETPIAERKKILKAEYKEIQWLHPDRIRERVVVDLASALGLKEDIVERLVKPDACKKLKITTFFPKSVWKRESPRTRSTRPASLWDALFEQPDLEVDLGEEADDEDDYEATQKSGKGGKGAGRAKRRKVDQ